MGFTVKKASEKGSQKGSEKGVPRSGLERPLAFAEYAPLNVRPTEEIISQACDPRNSLQRSKMEKIRKLTFVRWPMLGSST